MKWYPKVLYMLRSTPMAALCFMCMTTAHTIAQNVTVTQKWETAPVLETNESVLYNKKGGYLFVSCIHGAPLEKDNNGYIAQIDLSGKLIKRKWITGLNAPKGMGISKDGRILYVTDIDHLVRINIRKASIVERIPVPGTSFLNDIDIAEDGTVYFTDSNEGKLYAYKDQKISIVLRDLEGPNGILCREDDVLIVSFAGKGIYRYNTGNRKLHQYELSIPGGDGFVTDGRGSYFISDWNGAVYQVFLSPTPSAVKILDLKSQKKNAADITYLPDKRLLLIPTFFHNTVEAFELKHP